MILQSTVRNHRGVTSHVLGFFARRALNIEGTLCLPLQSGEQSRIWLQVAEGRLEQMVRQSDRLEDVTRVVQLQSDPGIFNRLVFQQMSRAAKRRWVSSTKLGVVTFSAVRRIAVILKCEWIGVPLAGECCRVAQEIICRSATPIGELTATWGRSVASAGGEGLTLKVAADEPPPQLNREAGYLPRELIVLQS